MIAISRYARTAVFFGTSLLALSAASGRLAAQPLPGYGASSNRFRVQTSTTQSQTQMGQTQEISATSTQLVSVAVAKAANGLTLSITVDSIGTTSTAPVPTPDVSALIGAVFAGAMSPDGHVTTSAVTGKSGNILDVALASAIKSFLPRLKIGATAGVTWSDTSSVKANQNGADVTTNSVVNYTLAGDSTVNGARHWKLTSTTTGTIAGNGNQSGADFTMSGKLSGKAVYVIGAGGMFAGANVANDVMMTVDVPMANMQIPIIQTSKTSITRIP